MLTHFGKVGLMIVFEKAKKHTIRSCYIKTLGITHSLKHFNFFSENSNPSSQLFAMASANTPSTEIIPTMEITIIHIYNESSINIEHFFDIHELKKVGLKLNETLLFCGARHFFNEP